MEIEEAIKTEGGKAVVEYIGEFVFTVDRAGFIALKPHATENFKILLGGVKK